MPKIESAKRRAHKARLLVFLLPGALLLSAPAAHAEKPLAPIITASDPASSEAAPATTTTPLLSGEAEPEGGIIIERVDPRFRGARTAALTPPNPTQHPDYEISIYTEAGCQGAPVATGRADTFEAVGLTVSVPANAMTTLSALQVDPGDPGHPSECSRPFHYWEGVIAGEPAPGGEGGGAPGGGTPPAASPPPSLAPASETGPKPAPPRLHMSPGARANDNEPRVAGSAPGGASVLVYDNSSCSGTPLLKGTAAELGSGLGVQVADNTTTAFSAVSVTGRHSACSAPVTYVEDSTAPLTRITMGPGVKTRKRKAVFRFTDVADDPPGTSFFCRVDRGKWKPCSSPLQLRHLRPSRHVVCVRAVDVAGNAETTGVKRSFQVVAGL